MPASVAQRIAATLSLFVVELLPGFAGGEVGSRQASWMTDAKRTILIDLPAAGHRPAKSTSHWQLPVRTSLPKPQRD